MWCSDERKHLAWEYAYWGGGWHNTQLYFNHSEYEAYNGLAYDPQKGYFPRLVGVVTNTHFPARSYVGSQERAILFYSRLLTNLTMSFPLA